MDRLAYFRQFHALTTGEFDLICENLKSRACTRGEFITMPGEVQKDLLFVENGVQMSYYEADDKAHVIAFTYPPDPCAIPESFSFQKPSRYFLKCISESEFKTLTFDTLQKLFDQSQGIERLFRKMTEAILAGMINRHVELQAMSMEERYLAFCKRSPHLLQLVPHKYIASYLAIDATNFSKLYNSIRI